MTSTSAGTSSGTTSSNDVVDQGALDREMAQIMKRFAEQHKPIYDDFDEMPSLSTNAILAAMVLTPPIDSTNNTENIAPDFSSILTSVQEEKEEEEDLVSFPSAKKRKTGDQHTEEISIDGSLMDIVREKMMAKPKGRPGTPSSAPRYCEICKKDYCNKYFFRTHMLKKHGITIEEEPSQLVLKLRPHVDTPIVRPLQTHLAQRHQVEPSAFSAKIATSGSSTIDTLSSTPTRPTQSPGSTMENIANLAQRGPASTWDMPSLSPAPLARHQQAPAKRRSTETTLRSALDNLPQRGQAMPSTPRSSSDHLANLQRGPATPRSTLNMSSSSSTHLAQRHPTTPSANLAGLAKDERSQSMPTSIPDMTQLLALLNQVAPPPVDCTDCPYKSRDSENLKIHQMRHEKMSEAILEEGAEDEEQHSNTSGSVSPSRSSPDTVANTKPPTPLQKQKFLVKCNDESGAFPSEFQIEIPMRSLVDGPRQIEIHLMPISN